MTLRERRLLGVLAACVWLAPGAAAGAEDRTEEKRCFRIPREQFVANVSRIGVFGLSAPEQLELPVDTRRDLERWVVSDLVAGGFEVEQPIAVADVWDGVAKQIRPRLAAGSPATEAEGASPAAWSDEMSAALRLHGRRELARRLDLDALLVPTLIVVPGPLPRIEQKVRPAALCLLVEAVDIDGTLLYENAACFGVVERVVGDGISLEASAATVRAPLRRRYLADEALHVLLGTPAPERPD